MTFWLWSVFEILITLPALKTLGISVASGLSGAGVGYAAFALQNFLLYCISLCLIAVAVLGGGVLISAMGEEDQPTGLHPSGVGARAPAMGKPAVVMRDGTKPGSTGTGAPSLPGWVPPSTYMYPASEPPVYPLALGSVTPGGSNFGRSAAALQAFCGAQPQTAPVWSGNQQMQTQTSYLFNDDVEQSQWVDPFQPQQSIASSSSIPWYQQGSSAAVPSHIVAGLTPNARGVYGSGMPSNRAPMGPEVVLTVWLHYNSFKNMLEACWEGSKKTAAYESHYMMADAVDSELDRIVNILWDPSDGAELARQIAASRSLEGNVSQLSSTFDFQLYGDASAANALKMVRPPGTSGLAPTWAREAALAQSQADYTQQLRLRNTGSYGKGQGNQQQQQQQPQGGKGDKGKGKGEGKGKGKGKQPLG